MVQKTLQADNENVGNSESYSLRENVSLQDKEESAELSNIK